MAEALCGGTLFSGIGAPEAAMPWVDWRWCAEIDPFACAVLAHHYPHTRNLGDVTEVDWNAVEPVDLVVGGPPCQGFSVAGQRGGLSDPRGNLSLAYVRALDAIDPLWSLTENVPGWLSMADNSFGHFLGRLVGADAALVPARGQRWTDAGVVTGPRRTAAWRICDAQYWGVPQRRRRVFVLAARGSRNRACAEALFPFQEGVRGNPAPRREAGERIAAKSLCSSDGGIDREDRHTLIATALRARDGARGVDSDCTDTLVTAFDARQSDVCGYGDRAAPPDTDGYTQAIYQEPITFDHQVAGSERTYIHDKPGRVRALTANKTMAVAVNNTGQGWWNDADTAASIRKGDDNGGGGARESTLVAYDITGALATNGARQTDIHTALRARPPGHSEASTTTVVAYGGNRTSGPIDVATAVNAHGGPHGRLDFESETFITHSLQAHIAGSVTEDGTGRGTPLVAVAIPQNLELQDDNRHNSSYASTQETDSGTLLRAVRRQIGTEAFTEWGLGILLSFPETEVLLASLLRPLDTQGTVSGELDFSACNGSGEDAAGAMREMRETGRARCPPPQWRSSRQSPGELGAYLSLLPQSGAPPAWLLRDLRVAAEGARLLQQALDTLEEIRRSAGLQDTAAKDVLSLRESREREGALRDALHAGEAGATAPLDRRSGVMSVRRLTPRQRECARLQGFPDSYLDITYRGRPAADGSKYKALGNSMCVPVVSWLGKRIQLVEDTIRSPAKERAA